MPTPTLEDMRTVWSTRGESRTVSEVSGPRRAVLGLLADGRPVTADQVATVTGWPVTEVVTWLEQARALGYEVDDHGRLVGAALTLRATPHRFQVRGNDLYAWCGFDTLFLPILLQEPAHVRSTCPVTAQAIDLDVAPRRDRHRRTPDLDRGRGRGAGGHRLLRDDRTHLTGVHPDATAGRPCRR